MKIKVKTFIPLLILLFLIVSEVFMYSVNFLRYSDEIVSVIFFLYIILMLIKKRGFWNTDVRFFILCICTLVAVGLLSNLLFLIQTSAQAVMLDIVANIKMPICCIGFAIITTRTSAKEIVNILSPFSKVFLLVGFICSLLSLLVDIGMRGQMRYGIWGFEFIFQGAHIYSMMIFFCLIICAYKIKRQNLFYFYLALAIVQLILTTKGISIASVGIMLIVLVYVQKREKINIKLIIVIAITTVALGEYQIREYLLNETAPRARLIKYGYLTARTYFPIGSGFGTFGSDMAAKYYSPLYVKYGFNSVWGMNASDIRFLHDNYWPMIMAQFGLVGLILVVLIVYRYFRIIQKTKFIGIRKAMLLSAFFYMIVASFGTTIFTTSATIILGLGTVLGIKLEE